MQPAPAALLPLTIADLTHQSTYNRDPDFGGFIDQNGCQDTSRGVLIRTPQAPVTFTASSDCTVTTGRCANAWSGGVDHRRLGLGSVVTDPTERVSNANDLTDQDRLVPILASENESKRDSGPDQWRPPRQGAGCLYALVWNHIKAKWHLGVTLGEWGALEQMAATC